MPAARMATRPSFQVVLGCENHVRSVKVVVLSQLEFRRTGRWLGRFIHAFILSGRPRLLPGRNPGGILPPRGTLWWWTQLSSSGNSGWIGAALNCIAAAAR
jgi:hypothetical protein